jgi:hypothetical protein
MVPKELEYGMPFAQGNVASCDTQGCILTTWAVAAASLYNCSICFYYLVVNKYNKRDAYIRNKLQPWFHGISILFALVCCTILLASKAFNAGSIDTLACFFSPNYPPHCIGFEDGYILEGFNIPCGCGNLESKPFAYAIWFIGLFSVQALPPLVIICTMLLMYIFILKVERRMQRYGVGSLRLRAQPNNPTEVGTGNAVKYAWKRIIPCLDRDTPASTSNNTRSQKRAILYVAAGYALAWALHYILNRP